MHRIISLVIRLFDCSQGSENLNKINKEKIWRLIQNTGDRLAGKLPEQPYHPKGKILCSCSVESE